ncbi:MAG: Major cardiolipin synthase ClsA [bacterium ADurb.Bin243]|nr:MAG: Major cardiolipin synthase ClsA [bacterium ADurb.Bin243]HOD40414.1 phosphatidylserine/phosphatidylglycerophosphate/cardiolipin synthase family protein [Candidatus Wallbacteria bacterium]
MKKSISFLAICFIVAAFVFASGSPSLAQQKPSMAAVDVFDELNRQAGNPTALARLLTDNNESWYARWYVMGRAKKSIDVTYFIVEKDVFGMSMLGMLLKKAREGVKVRLMMDARGTKELTRTMLGQDYLQELIAVPNVEIHVYNPASANIISAIGNIRNLTGSNHDKIIIVDGEWFICGGRNISMNYFVDPSDEPTVYRDTDVIIKGKKAIAGIQRAFDEEFNSHMVFNVTRDFFGNWSSRAHELELARVAMQSYISGMGLPKAPAGSKYADVLARYTGELAKYKKMQSYSGYDPMNGVHEYPIVVLDKHSFKGKRNDITPAISAFMKTARKEVMVQNPYVVLTPEAMDALKAANANGVAINIHTNSPVSSDSLLTQAFFLEDWPNILKNLPNCKLYAFNTVRKLHSKTFVFDREITVIGTYNMDYVSEQINSEVVVAIKSRDFGQRTALRILNDEKESVEYKVKLNQDGTPQPLFGPESHSDPKKIDLLNKLRKLGFLRSLI